MSGRPTGDIVADLCEVGYRSPDDDLIALASEAADRLAELDVTNAELNRELTNRYALLDEVTKERDLFQARWKARKAAIRLSDDRLAELDAECNALADALKDRRRTVLARGGGIARRVVADPEADRLLIRRGPT